MVMRHRRLRPLLLLCLLLNGATSIASQLQVKVERQRVELGRPIWLTLRSDQTAVSLNSLDFSRWRQRVAFPETYYVNINRDNTVQTLRLRLYPYRVGRFVLPALHFLHHSTAPLHFTVLPARDPVTKAPMDFICKESNLRPWQQQQLIVDCQLRLHDAFALLTQSAMRHDGLHMLPMQIQRHSSGHGQAAHTRYRLGWVVFAARAGKQILRLPSIEYVRDGVVTRRFYIKPLHLDVRALPAWLPGTIPVGRPGSVQYRLSQSWLSTGVLSQLQLRVQLHGVAPILVPDYSRQLYSDRQFMFYRAQQHDHTHVLVSGVDHLLDISIPLVAQHIGYYRLPDLRLQYFDPLRGTLETRLIRGHTVVVVNGWIKLILGVLFIGLLLWLGRRAWMYGIRYWRRFRYYQQALAIFALAPSQEGIRKGMRKMALAEGGHENLSLLQWQSYMRTKSELVSALPLLQFTAAVYGGGVVDFDDYVKRLQRICRQRRLALT